MNSRAWKTPGAAGRVNVTVALLTPEAGIVCVPFRYCHCTALPPASYRPTQSPGVPGASEIVALTVPPAVPVVAERVTVGGPITRRRTVLVAVA